MDLRYPLPVQGPPPDFARAKRIAGICAIIFGFIIGFAMVGLFNIPPVAAAVFTTLDFLVGALFLRSGLKQRKRQQQQTLRKENG